MTPTFQPNDPVPRLMDELIDALHLLHECRLRGVNDVSGLLDYIEYKIDEIEHRRLGMSRELFQTMLSAEEAKEEAKEVAC